MITKTDIQAVATELNRSLTSKELLNIVRQANGIYPYVKDYQNAYSVIYTLVEEVKRFR